MPITAWSWPGAGSLATRIHRRFRAVACCSRWASADPSSSSAARAIGVAISAFAVALTMVLVAFQNFCCAPAPARFAIGADQPIYTTPTVSNIADRRRLVPVRPCSTSSPVDAVMAALVALYLIHGAWRVGTRLSLDVMGWIASCPRSTVGASGRDRAGVRREVRDVHDLKTRSAGLTRFISFTSESILTSPSCAWPRSLGSGSKRDVKEVFPMIVHVPFGVAGAVQTRLRGR